MSNNWKKIIVVLSVMVLFFAGGRVFAQSEGWKKIADKTNQDQELSLEEAAEIERLGKWIERLLKKSSPI